MHSMVLLAFMSLTLFLPVSGWGGAVTIPDVPDGRQTTVGVCADGTPCDINAISCPPGQDPCRVFGNLASPTLVAQPIPAEFVLVVTDNETCDSDPNTSCENVACTTGTATTTATIQIIGHNTPGPPLAGRDLPAIRPFSTAPVAQETCEGVLKGYAAHTTYARLSERVLLETALLDLLYQPLPRNVAAAVLGVLRPPKRGPRTGVPVITAVRSMTVVDHDGLDPLPTVLRAEIELSLVRAP